MKILNSEYNYHTHIDNELVVVDVRGVIDGCEPLNDTSIHLKNEMANEWTKAMEDLEGHLIRLKQLGAPAEVLRTLLPLGACFPLNK
jgi:hypothetical protein